MLHKNLHAFGLDISDNSIEIACLDKNKKIKTLQRVKLPFGIVTNGKIKERQFLIKVLIQMLKKEEKTLKSKRVILALPESKIYAHTFKIPKKILKKPLIISKIAQDQIPIDLNEAIFDYKVIENKTSFLKREKEILFIAAERNCIYSYLGILKEAGLEVVAIDTETNSIARVLQELQTTASAEKKQESSQKKKKLKSKKTLEIKNAEIIIDIGAKFSVVTIVHGQHTFPSISIPAGGQNFTKIIQDTLRTENFEAAEELKKTHSLDKFNSPQIKEKIELQLDKIIQSTKNFIEFFENKTALPVSKLYICGGGSLLEGVEEYLQANFDLEYVPLKKLFGVNSKNDLHLYLNAIGLALRGIAEDPVSKEINLLPPPEKELLFEEQTEPFIIFSALSILLTFSLLVIVFNVIFWKFNFDLGRIEDENKNLFQKTQSTRYQEIKADVENLNRKIKSQTGVTPPQINLQNVEIEMYSVEDIYTYFYKIIPKNVIIHSFAYKNQNGVHKIDIIGFALTRDHVLAVEKSLKKSGFYKNISSPLSNILNKTNVRFTFSFTLDLPVFQEYVTEQKRLEEEAKRQAAEEEAKKKAAEEEARKKALAEQKSEQAEANPQNPSESQSTTDQTENLTETSAKNQPTEHEQAILNNSANLIESDKLEDLSQEIDNLSNDVQEPAEEEKFELEDLLQNSSGASFQDKIHEKVGDLFISEQIFDTSKTASGNNSVIEPDIKIETVN